MKDAKDNKTLNMFGAGRPRSWANDAEKMRAYRLRKQINKIMKHRNCTAEQAENLVKTGFRCNKYNTW